RLYTYPIRTASLVLVLMLQAMVAIAAELVLSTALLNLAFGLQWPLWGPALFAAVLSAAFLAVLWLFEKSGWVVPAMALTVTVLGLWFKWHDGPVFGTPTRIWSVVTPGDVLTLGLTTVAAYAVAVVGIARNRCGQPPLSLGFVAWFKRTFSATTSPIGRPFRTPSQAQLWFERRKKGWAIPATVTIGLVVGLLVWLIASRKAEALYEGLLAAGGLISIVGLLTGFLLGQVGSRETDLQIGQFLATRPVTSTEMARTILKCEATGLIIAWTIWAASFLALAETLRALQVTFPMRLLAPLGWWYFPATLVGPWAAMGLSTPLFLTGRKGFVRAIVIGSMVFAVGLMLFLRLAFSHEWQEQFFRGALLVVGIMLVLGTVWSFLAAQKRSLIGAPTVVVAASVWGALCALVAIYGISHPGQESFAYFLAVGILALAVSPLATAPLALAWNRNR
ncbi:MAG TPA: hypothetical protein VHX68_04245, partial [Planctomycetaceae bacterium]|nr:hypothetical protein [Planctomycetaceae bacterium]